MVSQPKTINQMLIQCMDEHAGKTCFRIKNGGYYRPISYQHFQNRIVRLAHYYQQHGIINGERVVIIAENSVEWMIAYIACLWVGGIAVPLRTSLPAAKLRLILQDSGAKAAVIQGKSQLNMINGAESSGNARFDH